MAVTLIYKDSDGNDQGRSFDLDHAERLLELSSEWKLPSDSKFELANGKLRKKSAPDPSPKKNKKSTSDKNG